MPYLVNQYKVGAGSAPALDVQLLGGTFNGAGSAAFGNYNATIFFNQNGTVSVSSGVSPTPDPWYIAGSTAGIGNDYEIRVTNTGGSVPGGSPLNTWINPNGLGSAWSVSSSGPLVSTTLFVEIRDEATQTIQTSGTYILTADKL